jgi:hypothetical protein
MWEHCNHILHKEQRALLAQQEDIAFCAEFAMRFEHFPKHLHTHTCRSEPLALHLKPEKRPSWLMIIQVAKRWKKQPANKQRINRSRSLHGDTRQPNGLVIWLTRQVGAKLLCFNSMGEEWIKWDCVKVGHSSVLQHDAC